MSTGAQSLVHRVHWPHRRALWLLVGFVVAAGVAVAHRAGVLLGRGPVGVGTAEDPRSTLVRSGVAPGVTAYVVGPHGHLGRLGRDRRCKDGRADASRRSAADREPQQDVADGPGASAGRGRKLSFDDTVQHWLPGLLRGYGSRITIRELMTDSSGLIDDNDIWNATPAKAQAILARIDDAKLRAQLVAAVTRYQGRPDS